MRDLPRGTVTFLFTDLEGSTRLLKRLGERYADVLREQQRILREAFEAAGGREIDTQGDSFFVAFTRAKDAVDAAVAAQRALASHKWPDGAAVRVRMGLHTGEPVVGDDRYVGLGVHKAARIGAAAHGGQILLSNATRELVEDELPAGVRLVDLGEHRLKDIDRPERVFQVGARGLRQRFPPLRVDAPPPRRSRLANTALTTRRRAIAAAAAALVLTGGIAGLALALRGGTDDVRTSTGGGETGPTAPGRDPDTIFPGKSIGAVKLGMSESDVQQLYGRGSEREWRSRGKTGTTTVFSTPDVALTVSFYNGKVVQVATTSPYYLTQDGIRVGSRLPYPASREEVDDALRRGELVQLEPGVYSWRSFVYEDAGYCLRGNKAATQLLLKASAGLIARVSAIFVTDAEFLQFLPAHFTGTPFGARDVFCAAQPLQR